MFGETVRAQRRRLGLTQEELAEKTGVSARSIRNLEAGRIAAPRSATVRLLADAFGLAGADRDGFCRDALEPGDRPRVPLVPAQLPIDIHGFTGRVHELAYLDTLLNGAGGQANAVVISAVSGTAGVGKTALAVHWAHRVRDRFPDGQLYVNLRGFDPGRHPGGPGDGACAGSSTRSASLPQRIPADVDAPGRAVPQPAGRQADAGGARQRPRRRQVRPLLPGTPGCLALVTSRNQLAGLVATDGAQPADPRPAHRRRGPEPAAAGSAPTASLAEPDAVDQIITACARLPLALAIVAARAAATATFPLAALAAELREARRAPRRDADDAAHRRPGGVLLVLPRAHP